MISRLAVSGYRSLRDATLGLDALTVVTGANGSGKSNLYRALRLLADVAQGRVIQSLAHEGGIASALWAGPEAFSRAMLSGARPVQGVVRRNAVGLRLGFSGADHGFAIDLGLPVRPPGLPGEGSYFLLDPEIKTESAWTGEVMSRASVYAERRGPLVRVRGETGVWREVVHGLAPFDSLMTTAPTRRTPPRCCCCASGCAGGASTTTCEPAERRPPGGPRSARAPLP